MNLWNRPLTLVEEAYAMASPGNSGGGPGDLFASLLPLLLIFGVLYFLIIRPQKKQAEKHKKFLGTLQKGDEVMTNSGICGKVTGVADSFVTLEIANNVKIKVLKAYIQGPVPGATVGASGSPSSTAVAAQK